MTAKELGKLIARDPEWKWQAGMMSGTGWRLVGEVSPGLWLMIAQSDEDPRQTDKCIGVPDYPNAHDPLTCLGMKDFAPRLVGEWAFDNKYENQG